MTTAEQVSLVAQGAVAERAHAARSGRDGEWRNADVLRAFLAVLDRITITAEGLREVRVGLPPNHHGQLWGYVADEALTVAMRRLGVTGTVTRADRYTYTLTINA